MDPKVVNMRPALSLALCLAALTVAHAGSAPAFKASIDALTPAQKEMMKGPILA